VTAEGDEVEVQPCAWALIAIRMTIAQTLHLEFASTLGSPYLNRLFWEVRDDLLHG
jgi:hypothetical protein